MITRSENFLDNSDEIPTSYKVGMVLKLLILDTNKEYRDTRYRN